MCHLKDLTSFFGAHVEATRLSAQRSKATAYVPDLPLFYHGHGLVELRTVHVPFIFLSALQSRPGTDSTRGAQVVNSVGPYRPANIEAHKMDMVRDMNDMQRQPSLKVQRLTSLRSNAPVEFR